MMQVSPPFAPDLRAAGTPPLIFTGQQEFQRFREAGLAGPVAPDDERQSRTRAKRQLRPGPDTSKAFYGNRFDERANGRRVGFRLRRRSRHGFPAKTFFDLSEHRGQHEMRDRVRQPVVALQPVEDVGLKTLVDHGWKAYTNETRTPLLSRGGVAEDRGVGLGRR